MKHILSYLFFALLFCSFSISATPPRNLTLVKQELSQYASSGNYEHDLHQAIHPAKVYLENRIKNNTNHKKLALVFDIDETVISHHQTMKKNDYGQTKEYVFNTILKQTKAEPIKPTLTLYHYAQKHNVAVFFITGRRLVLREKTIKLLQNCGYTDWTGLYFEPNHYHYKSAVPYKTAIRKLLTKQGYNIVLNVGDQYSDLKGGYADMLVKLPNPFYLVH